MSRPPRPLAHSSTTLGGTAFAARRQFLPVEFGEMVELELALAEQEAALGVTREDGDFAYTLFELSALVGHTLGLYQNLYAREAYIGTAETPRSLVLHARRLAYSPDPGLAASGWVAITAAPGVKGKLPKGFALSSAPRGEIKPQVFETIEDIFLDAARNEALPVERTRQARLIVSAGRGSFRLAGVRLGLAAGGYGVITKAGLVSEAVVIEGLDESDRTTTLVTFRLLDEALSNADADVGISAGIRFLALPTERLRRFGFDANPVDFPPSVFNNAGPYPATINGTANAPNFGYQATLESGTAQVGDHDVYLSAPLKANLEASPVIARRFNRLRVLDVILQSSATVAMRRGYKSTFKVGTIENGAAKMIDQTATFESEISSPVTYLQLRSFSGTTINRSSLSLLEPVYGGWQFDAEIVAIEPNAAPLAAPLLLDADFGDFIPGSAVAFESLDGTVGQVVEIHSLSIQSGRTSIYWTPLTDEPPGGWRLDNLKVRANLARMTHGESVEEILGGSDGTTPFLRFELKKAPLTRAPGSDGGVPEIEVRVNEVAWVLVEDFDASGYEDRHFRIETDHEQKASVIFGNGVRGAIPPSGKKHIRARYRQGLGEDGNTPAGAAGRIRKSHPLVARAANPAPLVGGAAAAGLSDLQRQATRYIRTFDRAVSVADHADLALLYPGVARASARLIGGRLQVVVATAAGLQPPLDQVAAFLDSRRDSQIPLEVVVATPVDLYLDIAVEHDPAYLTDNVKRAVQSALLGDDADAPGLFTFGARDFGQAAHLSQVYACISAAAGVTFVDVLRYRIEDQPGVRDVLQVGAQQWLRLTPSHLSLSISAGVQP